jgi:inosose dehydratase
MRLAFSAPTRDPQQSADLFSGFHAAGYEGLQLKTAQFQDHLDEPRRLLELWPTLHRSISGLIVGTKLDDAGRIKLQRVFRLAQAVEADLVVFCHSQPRSGLPHDDLCRIADDVDELGRQAADLGTKLSLHQHFNQPCMHRGDLDVFFDRPRSYGLTVDTAHLVKSGIADVPEVIASFRHAIDNFHMKDFAQGQFKVLGEGNIDFAPIFKAVRSIGYKGWIAADEESGSDLVSGMRACAAYLRQGLQ